MYCPECKAPLRPRDYKRRIWREKGGKTNWLKVPRCRCTNEGCKRLHTVLPNFLSENKHYDNELMEDVLDAVVSENDPGYEDYPSGVTMERWRSWLKRSKEAIEGHLRSAGFRLLDFTDQFLKSTESLLEELRRRISPGWLKAVLGFIYNSGGRLAP